ncbi:MAG: porin family protein [Rikenellaceae bacterium]|uniref:porin family protein n=1 Tax=Alistipes sp. TaxID=1872444 RepID=UPI00270C0242|nr:porin family protein [Alistipes sp.]MDO5384211.1 porin family protein [Rikenellaceae bacterium]
MWKIAKLSLLVILLGCGTLRAQHYIGVRGGWGGGSARFTPSRETGTEWGLYSGGISYKFYTAQKFVGAIQADLQYMGRGFMYDLQSKGDTSYHRTINSFELPLMWQPHFYFMQRHGRFFVNLGVYLSYFMDSKYYYKSKRAGIYEQGPYTMKLTRDTRWGYGLCGGAGLSFLIRRFEVAFEGRYYFGYSDVLRNGTKYQGNPTHSPLDNINVSMAFYYRLSKEGIRAEPSKGVARRMQEAEMRRAEKLIEKAKKHGDSLDAAGLSADSLPSGLRQALPDSLQRMLPDSLQRQKPEKRKTKREKTKKEYPAPAGTPGQTAGQPTIKETESIQESQKTDKK